MKHRIAFILAAIALGILTGAQVRCSVTNPRPGMTYVSGYVKNTDLATANKLMSEADAEHDRQEREAKKWQK
jgi:hypothetical protein